MIHVLGLAHTEATAEFSTCAYTDRTRVYASMMTARGHDVRLYWGEHNEATVTEHIPLVTRAEQKAWWPWYDPTKVTFNDFDTNGIGWRTFNARAIEAIKERAQPGDMLAITMGLTHKPVADALSLFNVEVGIGYTGVWAPYRIWESAAWRHFMAAREPTDDFRSYDATIPRAWEAADFPLGKGGDYHLFMGRLTTRKGPHIAAEACKRLGVKLVVAGQGVATVEPGCITTTEGLKLEGDVEYAGVVAPSERAALMGGAAAVWTPTQYLEPGGGVAIEAQLCGTPVIASSYGCFTESVADRQTGFLCSTLADYLEAGMSVASLDRDTIRKRAMSLYTTEAIGPQWDRYLDRLATLHGEGWYAEPDGFVRGESTKHR